MISGGIEMEHWLKMGYDISQSAFTFPKFTIKTLEQGVKYVKYVE